jgi:hypothetical protein
LLNSFKLSSFFFSQLNYQSSGKNLLLQPLGLGRGGIEAEVDVGDASGQVFDLNLANQMKKREKANTFSIIINNIQEY